MQLHFADVIFSRFANDRRCYLAGGRIRRVKMQQDKTAGEELQVGHNSDQIKDIVSFTMVRIL